MEKAEVARAVQAARAIAASVHLEADDAIVLHNSNRLTVRLLPCDVLARVAPSARHNAHFEVELARQLTEAGCPIAALDSRVPPRVHAWADFVVTLWTYYEPAATRAILAADYAMTLDRLHAGMRTLESAAPHFTERVHEAQRLVASRKDTPGLAGADRELLGRTLLDLRRHISGSGAAEQLLHGEPHPGNVVPTANGLLFVDLETCCRGPVEFDLAHAPPDVTEHYPGVDERLLHTCRLLVLAMIATWRFERGDQLPDGRRLGTEWLAQLRSAGQRDQEIRRRRTISPDQWSYDRSAAVGGAGDG